MSKRFLPNLFGLVADGGASGGTVLSSAATVFAAAQITLSSVIPSAAKDLFGKRMSDGRTPHGASLRGRAHVICLRIGPRICSVLADPMTGWTPYMASLRGKTPPAACRSKGSVTCLPLWGVERPENSPVDCNRRCAGCLNASLDTFGVSALQRERTGRPRDGGSRAARDG